ncbi:class I SAM-dependent methyltransferase [Halorussus salinisoli]|uniref:class I SAM-dependent methyltransferase n=1 Tax=Halorussus salinisoli TaxID=2558242 RepID=UPI0010C17278|nr:class I SAM-dependent methyltransferase [Halorussus salinisoli]
MTEKGTVRRGYDDLAETYAARRSEDERETTVLNEFLDALSEPTRILDAGCGQGTPVLRRLSEEATAIGVDFSREQLRLATETVPSASLVQGDMRMLPFRDGVFDAVTAYDSIIHVPLTDHQTVLDEFARVLAADGQLLLSEAPEEFERTNPDWLDSGVEMRWSMAGADATRTHLQRAGFRITNEWEPPDSTPEDGPSPPFFAARRDA